MNIILCVEQDIDTRVAFQITTDGSVRQAEPQPVYSLNAGDKAALELAVQLRDTGKAGRVTALTLAPVEEEGALRLCLARGVDTAVHVHYKEPFALDSYAVATILSRTISTLGFDLILCGHNGVGSQLGPVLAELLDVPQVTGVVQFAGQSAPGTIVADRRLERGNREKVACSLPALLTIEPSAQPLRYVPVRARLGALHREVQRIPMSSLLVGEELPEQSVRTKVVRVAPPRPRPKKIFSPDSSLSAEDRLALAISGGVTEKKGGLAEGNPRELAAKVVKFLRDQKLIGS